MHNHQAKMNQTRKLSLATRLGYANAAAGLPFPSEYERLIPQQQRNYEYGRLLAIAWKQVYGKAPKSLPATLSDAWIRDYQPVRHAMPECLAVNILGGAPEAPELKFASALDHRGWPKPIPTVSSEKASIRELGL